MALASLRFLRNSKRVDHAMDRGFDEAIRDLWVTICPARTHHRHGEGVEFAEAEADVEEDSVADAEITGTA